MPAQSSGTASLTYNSQLSTGLLTCTVTHTGDMIETSRIQDQRKTFLAGQATTTISGEIFYDQGDPCMAVMETDSINPVSRAIAVVFTTGMGVTGTGFVSSFTAVTGTNDVVRANFEIQMTGAVTIT